VRYRKGAETRFLKEVVMILDYSLRHVGDHGLSVEFANEISLQTNQKYVR